MWECLLIWNGLVQSYSEREQEKPKKYIHCFHVFMMCLLIVFEIQNADFHFMFNLNLSQIQTTEFANILGRWEEQVQS